MLRKTITISFLLIVSFILFAKCQNRNEDSNVTTIHVETAGTLERLLSFYQIENIENLKIIGTFDDNDIKVFQQMKSLVELDLSEAEIVDMDNEMSLFTDFENLEVLKLHQTTDLKYDAFLNCPHLKTIYLPSLFLCDESLYERLEHINDLLENLFVTSDHPKIKDIDGVLYSKDLSTLIYCPSGRKGSLEIPETVTTIANFAFEGSSISSITLSPNLKKIEDRSFTYCPNLHTVNLPARVDFDFLLDHFFNSFLRQIQYIYVHPDNQELSDIDGVLFYKDQTALLLYPNGRSNDYEVPNSVNTIGKSAFQNSLVSSIVLPQSLTTIQNHAFADSPINYITIPENVKTIGEGAFNTCYSLTSITLPQRYVYDDNTSGLFVYSAIEEILVDNNNPYLTSMDGVLFTKDQETLVCYPSKLTASYSVPDGVKRIDSYAFFDAQSPSIILPESIEYIDDYCFYESAIESITFPEGQLNMGKEVFGVCEYLHTIRIKSLTPPAVVDQDTGISEERKQDITLYIPAGTTTIYQNDRAWEGFQSYVEE